MKNKLLNFNKTKILVIGDIMLDRYWYGVTKRISPEAPVPIVNINNIKDNLGGAANVAMNVKSLGAEVHLVGVTGIDDASDIIDKKLNKADINCFIYKIKQFSTIIKLRIISSNQQLIRIDFEKDINKLNTEKILSKIYEIIPKFNAVIISDYNKGFLNDLSKLINKAKKYNIPVLVDPKGNNFSKYYGATILTPNILEFEAIVGKCQNSKQIINKGMNLIKKFKLSALLITQSEDGMTLLQLKKKAIHIPAKAKNIFDVTGAGDTVISVLATSLSTGESLEQSCLISNIAAGIAVGKPGTATVSQKEIEDCF